MRQPSGRPSTSTTTAADAEASTSSNPPPGTSRRQVHRGKEIDFWFTRSVREDLDQVLTHLQFVSFALKECECKAHLMCMEERLKRSCRCALALVREIEKLSGIYWDKPLFIPPVTTPNCYNMSMRVNYELCNEAPSCVKMSSFYHAARAEVYLQYTCTVLEFVRRQLDKLCCTFHGDLFKTRLQSLHQVFLKTIVEPLRSYCKFVPSNVYMFPPF